MKNLFLIIGAPGSGKTTDASLIAGNNSSVEHYSTGDLLRNEVASRSELGKKIENFISKGNLVPLEVVINAIISAIKNCQKDFILLDGYPRSVEQMNEFDKVIKENKDIALLKVIEVVVCEETAKARVLGRNRGSDDNETVFKNRMKVYLEPIDEIRKFYQNLDIYESVDGERSVDEIVAQINEIITNEIIKNL